MKNKLGILFVALLSVMVMTSATKTVGIEFEHVTLAEAKVMAKESGKLIFIDCYTDWCGPCRRMAKTSFKDEKVGKLFNESFINLKIEMEKNPDGKEVARQYKIRAYPTLLMINAEGKLVKQAIGMHSKGDLIQLANNVLKK
ncbi:MAG TPA: DUF255 domain-containing protein [Crocinitomicaceae bacterium]|nr:DUF255 domain-containing protein [Crocinitomicaceae bacterium]